MTPPTPLTVRLLPPREASDYEYFRNRLADLSVLENSVAVSLNRATLLAVAVGGQRRGGYLSVGLLLQALAIRRLLTGRPGFPDARVRWSPYRDTCHMVEWGDTPPWDDASRGRFYGYSDTAVTAFFQERTPQTA
ncbi:DUF6302 family protein [Streptomyces sp. NPDC020096]